jgi:hypothetical protein
MGEQILGGKTVPSAPTEAPMTLLTDAVEMFLQHVRVHSPDKPRTAQRYTAVLDHVTRILGSKTFVEAMTRPDIDDYKTTRSIETSEQHKDRRITPRAINLRNRRSPHIFLFSNSGSEREFVGPHAN